MPRSSFLTIHCAADRISCGLFRRPKQSGVVLERWATRGFDFSRDEQIWATNAATALEALLRSEKFPVRKCRLALPGTVVFTRVIHTPAVDRDKRDRVVRFEASQAIPFPLSEACWDYAEIEDGGTDLKYVLAAARTEVVETVARAVRRLGIAVERVEPEGLCLWRAHQAAAEGDAPAILAVVDRWSTLLVFAGATGFFSRTLTLGTESPAGGGDWSGLVARLNLEITRSRLSFSRRQEQGETPARILLTARSDIAEELVAQLAESCEIKVARSAPWGDTMLPENNPPDGGMETSAASLLGLLEAETRPDGPMLDLVPAGARAARARNRLQKGWLIAAALLALAGLPPLWQVRAQITRLEKQNAALDAALGPMRRYSQINQTSAAQLAVFSNGLNAAQRLAQTRYSWLELLGDLQNRVVATGQVWLDELQLVPAASQVPSQPTRLRAEEVKPLDSPLSLRVSGRVLDVENPLARAGPASYDRVKALFSQFEQSPWVVRVQDDRYDSDQPGVLRFTVILMLNPGRSL